MCFSMNEINITGAVHVIYVSYEALHPMNSGLISR